MDRNSIIGICLIVLLVLGYSIYTQPSAEQIAAEKKTRDSIALVEKQKKETIAPAKTETPVTSIVDSTSTVNTDSLENASRFGVFVGQSKGNEQLSFLENKNIKVTIQNKGGRIAGVQLKEYKTWDGKPVELFSADSSIFNLSFSSGNKIFQTKDFYFSTSSTANSVSMKLEAGAGKYLELLYSLPSDGYMLGCKINMVGLNDIIASNTNYLEADVRDIILPKEKSITNERNASAIYYRFNEEDVDHLVALKSDKKELTGNVKWMALKQQFFTTILVADQNFEKPTVAVETNDKSEKEITQMSAAFTVPFNHGTNESFGMQMYFGPNHYQTLKKIDKTLQLEKQINLGWGIFGWVNRFFVIPIFNFLDGFNWSYGLIILILTIAVRIVLLPLTYRSFISQAKMKVLQPEMADLNAKYPDDPMKKQQETMAMYRKAGVNPLGGCLPGLLQMPILIAMFSFFPASIELRQQGFLWADDLSTYDSIANLPFNIPFYGSHVSLFTLLMTISTLIYTRMNMQMSSAVNPQMKWIMYLMPIMFLGIFNSYSAGLSYYYFLSNVIGFGQQYIFKAMVDEDKIHRQIQENKKRPAAATKSKFQQRLEDMAKQRGYKTNK